MCARLEGLQVLKSDHPLPLLRGQDFVTLGADGVGGWALAHSVLRSGTRAPGSVGTSNPRPEVPDT